MRFRLRQLDLVAPHNYASCCWCRPQTTESTRRGRRRPSGADAARR